MGRLAPLKGNRLLDIGCGTGEYTRELAQTFAAVDAIDIEPERLELFSSDTPSNVTLTAMSASTLQFPDETFDVVTMIEVLEHLADPVGSLTEAARVLTPSGVLLITTPNRRWPIEQHGVLIGQRRFGGIAAPGLVWIKPLHRRLSRADAFSARDLRRLAGDSGLRVTGVTYMMPPLDSLGEGSRVHRLLDRAEAGRLQSFGQTIVASLVVAL